MPPKNSTVMPRTVNPMYTLHSIVAASCILGLIFQHWTGDLSLEKLRDTHPQHRQKSQSKYYYTHAPQPLVCALHIRMPLGVHLDIGQYCCSCSGESGHSFKISICE